MKKYILVLATIVFIGNITGQRSSQEPSMTKGIDSEEKVEIIKNGFLKGTINDKDDNPAIATIIITGENLKNGVTGAQTDEQGSFGIELPEGTYQIKIKQQGHNDIYQTITIEGRKNINLGTIRLKESEMYISCCCFGKNCHTTSNQTVTITKEDIRFIPPVKNESDIVTTLLTAPGCPGASNFQEITENTANHDEESSQGPFTGLEGHNFLEDPAVIYPNPVRDVMNVKSTDPITVIEILGINGQVAMELDPRFTMDVSGLAAGTYYARIHFENIKEVQIEKILVVK